MRHVEDRRDPALALGPVEPAQLETVGDILGDRHMRPQRIALEDHRHAAPLRRQAAAAAPRRCGRRPGSCRRRDRESRRPDAASSSCRNPTGPETDERAVRDRQTQRIERDGVAEVFRQRFEFDRRHNRYRLSFDRKKGTSIRPPPGVSRRSRRSIADRRLRIVIGGTIGGGSPSRNPVPRVRR